MRDLHLRHTLKQLAKDASAVFAEIVDGGQEIPYEIAESDESSAFCQYRPLSAKFVRDNATELRELETFREATETMRRSDVAATYLEEAGITPPADAVERATLAVTYFLARLWDGCSDFEIDEDRFSAALDEVEECAEPEAGEVEAIVPLIGFTAPTSRIELPGAAIVRADTVDVPPEAARSERAGGGEWEPTFVISARIELDADGGLSGAGERVAATFERVVTTLRLYKGGGVGLGPHGWVRVAGDRWRRIATGAGRPRTGGYKLTEDEIPALRDLARSVSVHPKRVSRLRRALLRFESGLDRRGAVDALNDHLLGLRFLLEGEGPAGVGLPMRAAALAADGDQRTEIKRTVEQAIALERELWSGEPASAGPASPSEVSTGIERLLRAILRRGLSGELGSDLRSAADELLLADGLAIGEGAAARGSTSEWELGTDPDDAERVSAEAFERFEADPEPEIRVTREGEAEPVKSDASASLQAEIEVLEDELPVAPESEVAEDPATASWPIATATPAAGPTQRVEPEPEPVSEPAGWLEEVDEGPKVTMDFPRRDRDNHIEELSKPPMEREEVKARVQYLFPRTETDWTVGRGEPRRPAKAG